MAPDVLGQSYGHKCDIWSCGVIAYLILTGKQPFKGANDEQTFQNIAKGLVSFSDPIWSELSDTAQDFVKKLLTWDQALRPTAAEALLHPWIVKKAHRTISAKQRSETEQALNNLGSFDAHSKLRVATCTFIASQLMDREEKEKIDDVFRAIDYNNDGTLNREEVKAGYEQFFDRKLTDAEIDRIFENVDASGTGELEYSQFLFGALDKKDLLSSANLKKAFSIFDKDGSGDISADELETMLLGEGGSAKDRKAMKKYIAQVDKDGDGEISYEEFVQMALGTPGPIDSSTDESESEHKAPGRASPIEERFESAEENHAGEALDATVTPEPAATGASDGSVDSRLKHIYKSIDSAGKREVTSRSNCDPPTVRVGRVDPPSVTGLPVKGGPPGDNPIHAAEEAPGSSLGGQAHKVSLEPPTSRSIPLSTLARGRRRASTRSARSAKIDEACQGFDKVQEKIARLRMLLSTKEAPAGKQQAIKVGTREPKSARVPNVETLDSAFAKLSEIQRKMRALQALAKSAQAELR